MDAEFDIYDENVALSTVGGCWVHPGTERMRAVLSYIKKAWLEFLELHIWLIGCGEGLCFMMDGGK